MQNPTIRLNACVVTMESKVKILGDCFQIGARFAEFFTGLAVGLQSLTRRRQFLSIG